MATGREVLEMLIPQGGWIISGDAYEGIEFVDCESITKAKFEAGFAQVDAWKAEQDTAKAEAKTSAQAKLAALGLTVEDLAALGL
jgi:helix-turn-helix protein